MITKAVILFLLVCGVFAEAQILQHRRGAFRSVPGPFLNDTFTGTDSTAITAHLGELGATWQESTQFSSGDALLASNRLRSSSISSVWLASGVPDSANYSVNATLRYLTAAGTSIGIVGRADNPAENCYIALYYRAGKKWELYKSVTGTLTSLGSYSQTLSAGVDYKLTLTMSGTTITLLVDDVSRVSVTDSAVSQPGRCGLWTNGSTSSSTGIHIDRVWSSDLTPGPSPTTSFAYVVDGDSLTTDYARLGTKTLAMLLSDRTRLNSDRYWLYGVPGQTAVQMNSDATTQWDAASALMTGYTRKLCIIEAGINDLAASSTAAAIIAELQTSVSKAAAEGLESVVLTITEATSITAGKETNRQTVNAAILDGTVGATITVDAAGMAHAADPTDTNYFVDGVHWTETLAAEIADLVVSEL